VAVSTTIKPVTHTAEVAVNREATKTSRDRSAVEKGIMRNSVPIMITTMKLNTIV